MVGVRSPQGVEYQIVLGVDDPVLPRTRKRDIDPSMVLGRVPQSGDRGEQGVHVATRVTQEMKLPVEGEKLGNTRPVYDARLEAGEGVDIGSIEARCTFGVRLTVREPLASGKAGPHRGF